MIHEVTPQFSAVEILQLLKHNYNLVGELKALPGYSDQNLRLSTLDNQQYIIK